MVAPNGIYKLAVIGTVHGQQHVHTLHFRSTAVSAVSAMDEATYMNGLVDYWRSQVGAAYRNQFAVGIFPVQQMSVRKVCGSLPLPIGYDELEPAGTSQGSQSAANAWGGDALAPWLCGVVTLRTNNAGRSYRGRSFIGGLHEGGVTGATISSERLGATEAYFAALKTTFIDPGDVGSFRLFVFSRLLAVGKPADPTTTPPTPAVPPVACQLAGADAQSYLVRSTLATMKSRKAGSGL